MNTQLKHIEIEGVDRPFILNILALREFSRIHGIKRPSEIGEYFTQFDFTNPEWEALDMIATLIVCGLDEGARKENVEQKYKSREVLEILSTNPEVIHAAMEDFAESVNVETEGKTATKKAKAGA